MDCPLQVRLLALLLWPFQFGDIVESLSSVDGIRIVVFGKMDKSVFIIYNVYVQNTSAMAKTMFTEFSIKFKSQANLQDAYLIIGGD